MKNCVAFEDCKSSEDEDGGCSWQGRRPLNSGCGFATSLRRTVVFAVGGHGRASRRG